MQLLLLLEGKNRLRPISENSVGEDRVLLSSSHIVLKWLLYVFMQRSSSFGLLEGLIGGLNLRLRVLAVKTRAVGSRKHGLWQWLGSKGGGR